MFKYFIAIPALVIGAAAFVTPVSHCGRPNERAKCAEAFNYLQQIEGAQERHYARVGHYADGLQRLDFRVKPPRHFVVEPMEMNSTGQSWSLGLRRINAGPGAKEHGEYRVVWTQGGFEHNLSELPDKLLPVG